MKDCTDSCFDFECMESCECMEKRERLMREKALKSPFLQEDQEEPEMEERDEEDKVQERERPVEEEPENLSVEKKEPWRPIGIYTEDEEDRAPEKYEEEERPVEEEEPRYNMLDVLCEVLKPELDARWNEKNAVGHGEEKPQKEAKLVGENKDEKEWEPKKSNNSNRQPRAEDSLPEMPEELKNHIQEMGGRSVKFLMERRMFKTDEGSHLPIPIQEILTEEEERMFLGEGIGMEVEVVEPCLQHAHIAIRKWKVGKGHNYVFANKNWVNVVERNVLWKGTVVQVWSFRNMDSKLCFAVVRV